MTANPLTVPVAVAMAMLAMATALAQSPAADPPAVAQGATATPAAPPAPAAAPRAAAAASAAKDIVLDAPQRDAPAAAPTSAALPPSVPPDAARRLQAASALADLGLHLARHAAPAAGKPQANQVASPYSVGVTLGMLHEGAADATAAEIARVLEPGAGQGGLLRSGLGNLPAAVKGDASTAWFSPSRIWVGSNVAAAVPVPFQQRLQTVFGADGAVLDFAGQPEAARSAINQWTASATQDTIRDLLPAGSIRPDTRVVVTNAAYFKGQWETPFETSATRPATFHAEAGPRQVPTMHGAATVREATVDNVYVMELGFRGGNFAMLFALPPAGHTLQALQAQLMGADIAGWAAQLRQQRVDVALPRFNIKGGVATLDDSLRAAGMATAFTDAADFSPMMGRKTIKVDHVFHSATIDVNELGTVATAATAATAVAKSLAPQPLPRRAFDRPFLFVLLHKPTGAPLFVGRVVEP